MQEQPRSATGKLKPEVRLSGGRDKASTKSFNPREISMLPA